MPALAGRKVATLPHCAGVAQRQSSCFVNSRLRVRFLSPAPNEKIRCSVLLASATLDLGGGGATVIRRVAAVRDGDGFEGSKWNDVGALRGRADPCAGRERRADKAI